MPRPPRQDHEGAWQHIMNRGIDRGVVFQTDEDRGIFLECLASAASRYQLRVHAYCLLGNHFHLLLFGEAGRLSEGMRFLGGRFTQRINYRHGRDGPLFCGRYASVMVKSDAHLVRASRYIHRNPVEAGLVREPWDWAWSSTGAYLGLVAAPEWLVTEEILNMFNPQGRRQEYRAFLEAEIDDETRKGYRDSGFDLEWGQTRRV
jgi:putative transposase